MYSVMLYNVFYPIQSTQNQYISNMSSISENIRYTMTFKILSNKTYKIIHRPSIIPTNKLLNIDVYF